MMKSGYFNQSRLGGYTITDPNLKYSYQYNLLNRDILVQLDQNGPVYIQAAPPGGIVLLRREHGEKFSKWLTFFRCGGKMYSNFARPGTECYYNIITMDDLRELLAARNESTDLILTGRNLPEEIRDIADCIYYIHTEKEQAGEILRSGTE